jgi:hypothetical protein
MEKALLFYDLQMHSMAMHFDLWDKQSRIASATALASFFFDVVKFLEPPLFIEAGAKEANASLRARRIPAPASSRSRPTRASTSASRTKFQASNI